MILITGGSYQGKLDFARRRFGFSEAEIQSCDDATDALDFSRRCLAYIDRFALNRVRAGVEPTEVLKSNLYRMTDAVCIVNDISGGVVPVDPTLRAWREACGRMSCYLAGEAEEVWRLFCGIPHRLK